MSKHFQRELDHLKRDLLLIGAMVEEGIEKSIVALEERRRDLAQQVIETDQKVDHHEVDLEESCLKILALHQPVAEDLRFVAAVIRINNDLERMGDYAVSIAERALHFMDSPIPTPKDLKALEALARQAMRKSLDAFVKKDAEMARRICASDDPVDRMHRQIFEELRNYIREHPDQVDSALDLITVARRLERIGDMATNIAQDVVYMVDGEIVRHRFMGS